MAKHASSCSSALICVLGLLLPLVRPANLNCCGAHGPVSGSRTWRLARACMPRGLGLCTGCNELADFIAIADRPDIRRHSNPLISIMNCRSHRWPAPPAQALPSCPPAAVTGGFYVRAPARGTRVPDLTCVLSLSKVYSLSFRLWSFWVVRTEELETRIPQLNPPVDWMMPQCTDLQSHMSTSSSSSSSSSTSSSSSSSSSTSSCCSSFSSCCTCNSYISTWWRSPIHGT